MPGLIGAVQMLPGQDVTDVFHMLLSPMQRNGRLLSEICIAPNGRWALGRLHLGILQPSPQLTGNGSIKVLFHGDLSNEIELRKAVEGEGSWQSGDGIIPLIAALYRS